MTMAVAVALFAWLGYRADAWGNTSPLFLLVGVALGVTGGFIHLLRVLAPDILPFGWGRPRGKNPDPTESGESDSAEHRDLP